jgi:glycolate oxidase iron-sulfur subunit
MKKLEDYSEDIYKCTKCGLCQSVCPIFEATGLETAVSRGKFTLLNGILQNKLKLNKNTSKYFDLCLNCKACYDFCPSGINAEEIIIAARHLNYKTNGNKLIKRIIISVFDSKMIMNCIKTALFLYRRSGMIKITNFLSQKIKFLKPFIYVLNTQINEHITYKKQIPEKPLSNLKLIYFPGCFSTYINQSVKNAIKITLEINGMQIKIPDFSCCGLPARNIGDFDTFKKQAQKNLDLIDNDADFILTDCASCGSVFHHYADIVDDEYKEKTNMLASKAMNIHKFLSERELYIPDNINLNFTVTYHDPCHLKRFQNVYSEPRNLLKRIPGINLIEMKDADKCCGAAGSFCAVCPDISKKISAQKAQNIITTEADIVTTSCPGCKIGIAQGLAQFNTDKPILQPVELLAKIYLPE